MSLQGQLISHMLQQPCFRYVTRIIPQGRKLQKHGLRQTDAGNKTNKQTN